MTETAFPRPLWRCPPFSPAVQYPLITYPLPSHALPPHTLIQYVPPNSNIFWVLLLPLRRYRQGATLPAQVHQQNSFITATLPNWKCLPLYIPICIQMFKIKLLKEWREMINLSNFLVLPRSGCQSCSNPHLENQVNIGNCYTFQDIPGLQYLKPRISELG